MANVKTEQEPSIEEILESIRQIISDEEEPEEEPLPEPSEPADILDLTEKINPDSSAAIEMVEPPPPPMAEAIAMPLDEPPPEPLPEVKNELETINQPEPINQSMTMDKPMTDDQNSLISAQTANAATEELSKLLANNVAVERDEPGRTGKVTLEEMALELMKPMIKTWLDQNLPGIIEKVVQKEVEKLSRRATDR
jgi:hypothetical protein